MAQDRKTTVKIFTSHGEDYGVMCHLQDITDYADDIFKEIQDSVKKRVSEKINTLFEEGFTTNPLELVLLADLISEEVTEFMSIELAKSLREKELMITTDRHWAILDTLEEEKLESDFFEDEFVKAAVSRYKKRKGIKEEPW